jgi:uncharacterized protein YodC (DUF2158 family)
MAMYHLESDTVSDASIKLGDVVQLLSGGPLMTVFYIEERGTYRGGQCVWFTESGKVAGHLFPLTTLKLIHSRVV